MRRGGPGGRALTFAKERASAAGLSSLLRFWIANSRTLSTRQRLWLTRLQMTRAFPHISQHQGDADEQQPFRVLGPYSQSFRVFRDRPGALRVGRGPLVRSAEKDSFWHHIAEQLREAGGRLPIMTVFPNVGTGMRTCSLSRRGRGRYFSSAVPPA